MAFQRTLITAAVAFGSIGRTWTMLSMKRVCPSPWLLAATAYKAAYRRNMASKIVGNSDFTSIFAVAGGACF